MRKILLIRLSSIGDIVLTSLCIRCVREAYPNVQIDFLTKSEYSGLVENHLNVNKVISLSSSLWQTAQEIIDENYDVVFDLHSKTKTWLLQQLLPKNIPFYRYQKHSFRRNLSVLLKKNFYPDIKIPEQYLEIFKPFGIKNDGKGLDFFIPESQWIYRSDLPLSHRSGYAVLSLGATHFTKKLPVHQWEKIIRELSLPIILIGGKDEIPLSEYLSSLDEWKVVNKCGVYSLGQSASVVAQAKFVITQDTGMMHIAAALNAKLISIWGGTVPYFGFEPYGLSADKNFMIQNNDLSCRPCSKYGQSFCPKGHFNCMNQLRISDIVKATTSISDKNEDPFISLTK